MSFRINTNISALTAYNDINKSAMQLGKTMSRLSKGLRIAEASDDPAGLISSELFRSQINSMDVAYRNNQEAVNYSKIAENSLGEVSKLLSEARGLAVAASNAPTLSAAQVAANQEQLSAIVASINRVSTNTQYGSRKLLDGSAGVTTQVSDNTKIQGISFSGTSGSTTVTQNGLITLAQTTAATRALYTATAALTSGALATGSFAINGVSFNVTQGTSGSAIANMVNAASSQTGVTAAFDSTTNSLSFQRLETGSNRSITFSDTNGVISSASNTNAFQAGTDAVASVNFGAGNVLFTGGRNGLDGLTLRDASGNEVRITEGGNATSSAAAVGRVIAGDSTFQIGSEFGQTASLALRNMSAGQLGSGVVAGATLATIDLSTSANAGNAMKVIDKAIEEVSSMRGRIGSFTRYTLETNSRSLSAMKENLAAAESTIRDLDMASEMTTFTKLQVMQQAGMSVLSQANQQGQAVLSLLR